jgi:hypothetical protein
MSTEFHLANTSTGVTIRILTAHPTVYRFVFRFISRRPAPGADTGLAGISDFLSLLSLLPSLFSIVLRVFCGLTWLVFLESAIGLASLAKVLFEEGGA